MTSSSVQMSKLDKACKEFLSVLPLSGSRSPLAMDGKAEHASFMPLHDGSRAYKYVSYCNHYKKRFARIKQSALHDPSKPVYHPELNGVRAFKRNHIVCDPDWTPTPKRPPPTDVQTILNGILEISEQSKPSKSSSPLVPTLSKAKKATATTTTQSPKRANDPEPIKKSVPARPTTGGKSIKSVEMMKALKTQLAENNVDFFLVKRFLPFDADDPAASRRVEQIKVASKPLKKPASASRSTVKLQRANTTTAVTTTTSIARPDLKSETLKPNSTKRGSAKPPEAVAASLSKSKLQKTQSRKTTASSSSSKTENHRSDPLSSEISRKGPLSKLEGAPRVRETVQPESSKVLSASSKSKVSSKSRSNLLEPPNPEVHKREPGKSEVHKPTSRASDGRKPDGRRPNARRPDPTRVPTAKKSVNGGNARPVLRIHVIQAAINPDARGSKKQPRTKHAHIPRSIKSSSEPMHPTKRSNRTSPPLSTSPQEDTRDSASYEHDRYMPVKIEPDFLRSMKIPKRRPAHSREGNRREDGELEEGETISPSLSPSSSPSHSSPRPSPKRRHTHDDDREDVERHQKSRRHSYHRDDQGDEDERHKSHRSLDARHGANKETRRRDMDQVDEDHRKRQKSNGEQRRGSRQNVPERQRRRSSDLIKNPKTDRT